MVVGPDPVHAFAFIELHVFGGLVERALRHGEMSPLMLDAGDVVQPEFGIAEIVAAQQTGVSGDLEPDRTGIGIAVPQDAAVGLDVKADGILEHFRQFAFGWRWDRTAPDMAAGQTASPAVFHKLEAGGVVDDHHIRVVAVAAGHIDPDISRQTGDDRFAV